MYYRVKRHKPHGLNGLPQTTKCVKSLLSKNTPVFNLLTLATKTNEVVRFTAQGHRISYSPVDPLKLDHRRSGSIKPNVLSAKN
jgi:hypothetical protein